jgi:hypothetical protein
VNSERTAPERAVCLKLAVSEFEYDAGREPEIVLALMDSIIVGVKLCHQIIDLKCANRDVFIDTEIESAADNGRECNIGNDISVIAGSRAIQAD